MDTAKLRGFLFKSELVAILEVVDEEASTSRTHFPVIHATSEYCTRLFG